MQRRGGCKGIRILILAVDVGPLEGLTSVVAGDTVVAFQELGNDSSPGDWNWGEGCLEMHETRGVCAGGFD